MTTIALPALMVSVVVATLRPVAWALKAPFVVSSPAANVMLCAPAANEAVAVVHTMLNVPTVIVHGEVSVAVPPDAGTSNPAGEGLAEK